MHMSFMKISRWARGEVLSVPSWEKSVLAEFSRWAAKGCHLRHSCNTRGHDAHCPLKMGEQESLGWEFRGTPGEALLGAWQYFRCGEREMMTKGKGRSGVVGLVGCIGHTLGFSLYPRGTEC